MRPSRSRAGVAALAAAAALSLIRLRALPVFGDEAIFLRFARLVRSDPGTHAWISIRAAAAPLHTWLLAAGWAFSADPVRSGRLLSVAAGIASIPAMAWTVSSVRRRLHPDGEAGLAGVFSAALVAASPFFLWTSRVARVDSLFAAETIFVAGASLWLAARIEASGSRRQIFAAAAPFGVAMGALMLTRTAVSYPYWILPAAALVLRRTRRIGSRALTALVISLAVGFGLFAPFLLAGGPENVVTRLFHYGVTRPSVPFAARVSLAAGNARMAFESFAAYLSPPVLAGAAAAVALLALRRRWRALSYLLVWETVALLPALIFAGDYFPRYALPAAAPLLACVALALEEIRRPVRDEEPFPRRTLAAATLALLLVAAGGIRAARFVRNWRTAPWTPIDRWQLVSGWPAGAATEEAVAFLKKKAAGEAVLVLTPEISGNPTDSVWLLLEGARGVDLAFAMDALHAPLLAPAPGQPDSWQAREDLVRGANPRFIPCTSPRSILFVVSDPILSPSGWRPAGEYFSRLNPGLVPVARFENPPPPGKPPTDAVAVFSIRCLAR
ncbi:MAG: hypothetical protein M3167_07820 [Acidobacteriota bacterium]|nr:hypothetical protein [Acidobacteriota bacterium]